MPVEPRLTIQHAQYLSHSSFPRLGIPGWAGHLAVLQEEQEEDMVQELEVLQLWQEAQQDVSVQSRRLEEGVERAVQEERKEDSDGLSRKGKVDECRSPQLISGCLTFNEEEEEMVESKQSVVTVIDKSCQSPQLSVRSRDVEILMASDEEQLQQRSAAVLDYEQQQNQENAAVLDSTQRLLSILATKHRYVEYEEEDSEYDDESLVEEDTVVVASLQIPLLSPVRLRATLSNLASRDGRPLSPCPTSPHPSKCPASPLALLSQRLARRTRGQPLPSLPELNMALASEIATQTSCTTSTTTLLSPAPKRQACDIRASTFYTAPNTPIVASPRMGRSREQEDQVVKDSLQDLLSTLHSMSSSLRGEQEEQEQEQDNLQDIILTLEEMSRVQQEEDKLMEEDRLREKKLKKLMFREMQVEQNRQEKQEAREQEQEEAWARLQEVPCSPCTRCKKKQELRSQSQGKEKESKKKPVLSDILFGCFKSLKF